MVIFYELIWSEGISLGGSFVFKEKEKQLIKPKQGAV